MSFLLKDVFLYTEAEGLCCDGSDFSLHFDDHNLRACVRCAFQFTGSEDGAEMPEALVRSSPYLSLLLGILLLKFWVQAQEEN